MSKKNQIPAPMQTENRVLKHDLWQTVIVNLIFLGLLIGLYYWNKGAGEPLTEWVSKFIE